jgi:hypothetical protein
MPTFDFECRAGHFNENVIVPLGTESIDCAFCKDTAKKVFSPCVNFPKVSGDFRTSVGNFTSRTEWKAAMEGREPINLSASRKQPKVGFSDTWKNHRADKRWKREVWRKSARTEKERIASY